MATASNARHVLITGTPGVGKTTLVRKICETLQKAGTKTHGFYTEEVREGKNRIGFDVVTLDGRRGMLSRVKDWDPPSGREYAVGKYKVNLVSFESTALTALRSNKDDVTSVVVIDEIGKMELFSQSFKQTVIDVLNQPDSTVIATVPTNKGPPIPFVQEVKSRADAKLFTVTKANRDEIMDNIVKVIQDSVKSHGAG